MTQQIVYILCAATSLLCAILLARGYRRSGARLLLWSCLCFIAMFLNNILLFLDKIVMTETNVLFGVEFQLLRAIAAFVGMAILLFGLIWDSE